MKNFWILVCSIIFALGCNKKEESVSTCVNCNRPPVIVTTNTNVPTTIPTPDPIKPPLIINKPDPIIVSGNQEDLDVINTIQAETKRFLSESVGRTVKSVLDEAKEIPGLAKYNYVIKPVIDTLNSMPSSTILTPEIIKVLMDSLDKKWVIDPTTKTIKRG